MALDKLPLAIPFSTGIDTKTDPKQVLPTRLLALVNAVYTKDKRLTKRNGYAPLTTLPVDDTLALATFKDSLLAIGSTIYAYNDASDEWLDHGRYQPVDLSITPLSRSSGSQTSVDAAVSGDLVCSLYYDSEEQEYQYQINNLVTSQQIVPPTTIAAGAAVPRIFLLGGKFVITFLIDITATTHLQYIAIPVGNVFNPTPATDIATTVSGINAGYDGLVANSFLYIGWNGSDVGGAIRASLYDTNLNLQNTYVSAGSVNAEQMSFAADMNDVFLSFYDSSTTTTAVICFNSILFETLPPTAIDTTTPVAALTSAIEAPGVCNVFQQVINDYTYAAVRSDLIQIVQVDNAGAFSGPVEVARSVGLASKAFTYEGRQYMLALYQSDYQPTYFLIDSLGNVIAKLAYSNSGTYVANQVLPSPTLVTDTVFIPYLYKATLTPVNKSQGVANVAGIYSQLGANLASINLAAPSIEHAEIGNNLHLTGGFVWLYDGNSVAEHNFHLFPDNILTTPFNTGGASMTAQQYYYAVTYEWTDAQGNLHRSAPSVPMGALVTGGENSVILDIPTLRLTYKQLVRIVIYRWSVAQQVYYQITSITSPTLNDPTMDSITYTDVVADSAILGNQILYTTGGVVENIAYPAASSLALYKSRLMVLDSEDRDLIWYSKQVIQGTPAEPSDLFTMYIAPTTGGQGSNGITQLITAMDDKLLISKENAWLYVTGDGPNNTGNDNTFSEPTFISAVATCNNHNSLVLAPNGLMFQSNKGLWMLSRGLQISYIGADVEDFGFTPITSAVLVPGTNQVRFMLADKQALMYDYYYDRWGTFNNVASLSSIIYKEAHTMLTPQGQVRVEIPGFYQDGTQPVTMSFTTAWINVAGVQGLERVYKANLLTDYFSPHKIQFLVSYDYGEGPSQSVLATPDNFVGPYGVVPTIYGQGQAYGSDGRLSQWELSFNRQKVQALKLQVIEVYDPSISGIPGEGLTFNHLLFTVGIKRGSPTLRASRQIG